MKKNDVVNHPKHYTSGFETKPIECIDITRHMSFCTGNAFKYVWRAGKKGGKDKELEDLKKALWYIEDIECTAENPERGPCKETKDMRIAAITAFSLIKEDDSDRYAILHFIVWGKFHLAEQWLIRAINRLEGVEDGKD